MNEVVVRVIAANGMTVNVVFKFEAIEDAVAFNAACAMAENVFDTVVTNG